MSADKNPSIFRMQMEAIVYMEREKINFPELHLIKGCKKNKLFSVVRNVLRLIFSTCNI